MHHCWIVLSVRRRISQQTLLTLVSTFVANRDDYCCSVMVDVLGHLMDRLMSLERIPLV